MNKNALFIFFLLLLQLIYSCEYDKDFTYTNEISTQDENFVIEINLSHVSPNSTIYIYDFTKVSFAIDSKGHDFLKYTISFEGEADIYDNYIYLYPLKDNSVAKLVFDIELKTNTGSIAENMGYEKYVGRYEFDVKFVKLDEEFTINFFGKTSDEGHMQLCWDEPIFENAFLQKYEIKFYNDITGENETHTFTDPKQLNYIDKSYVWGFRTYEISFYYTNKDVSYTSTRSSNFTTDYFGMLDATKFSYQFIDHEWMNVSWDHTGYKCKYLMVNANGEKIECDENQRNVRMQRFRFPLDPERFRLYILPYDLPFEEYEKCPYIAAEYERKDERSTIIYPPMAWDIEIDEYYCIVQDGLLQTYSISNFEKKGEIFLRPFVYFDSINLTASSKTSQIALFIYYHGIKIHEIFIYHWNDIDNPVRVKTTSRLLESIYLTDNYRLFFVDAILGENDYYLYSSIFAADTKTGEIVSKRKLMLSESTISVSSNGNYLCEYKENDLQIYKYENDEFIPIYSYHNTQYPYKKCQFSNTNPNELILSGEEETIVFDVNTLSERYRMNGEFVFQDPITGNFGCYDEKFSENSNLNIYDNTLSKLLARIPFCYYRYPHYFLNNRIIVFGPGIYAALDITDYIK